MERLHKFLASRGVASRRHAEKLIAEGRVKVNGRVVREAGFKIDDESDKVEVDDKVVPVALPPKIYVMLNKPPGCLSSVRDPHAKSTVIDLVERDVRSRYPGHRIRLYPVGRLDLNSRGLILLTNDGDLAFGLTHPGKDVPKTYLVRLDRPPSRRDLERFAGGLYIDDDKRVKTRAAEVSPIRKPLRKKEGAGSVKEAPVVVKVTLREGRKRQIRRMFSVLGYKVLDLKRVAIGPLKLGSLPQGKWRFLSGEEVEALKASIVSRREDDEDGG
ncbi:MAG TPA: rRNA pseudouridine synthase [Clostridia bacterium]|nr:rRNA pseudouridine synthase [Clostridia bacterium]